MVKDANGKGCSSYMAGGKQYIAVTTGWGSHVSGNFRPLYGEPFASMPTDNGQLLWNAHLRAP